MIIHQNKELFVNYIRITAQQMKIPAIYVEKDYWVTYALYITELLVTRRIFLPPWHYENSISKEKRNLVYIYLIGLNLIKSKNGNS